MGLVCQILINRPPNGIHYVGGSVSGVVKYAIDYPSELKDVLLSLKGESYCSWSESDSDDNSTTYTGQQDHVVEVVSLSGTLINGILPPGTYDYKFLFTLPKNIPPSFKRNTGHVTYQILLEFKKEGIFSINKKFHATIPVQNFLDPVLPDTAIIFGVDKEILKPFTFGRHKVHLKAEIANPYLKPGDTAHLKFDINNNSILSIKCIKVELVSLTVFTAQSGRTSTSTERIDGCKVETKAIQPYEKASMVASVPTKLYLRTVQYSKVVSHEYKILVSVVLPWPHWNARVAMPVLIGWREGELDVTDKESAKDTHPPEYSPEWEHMEEYKEKPRKK